MRWRRTSCRLIATGLLDCASSSVAVQELMNNATTLNFNALLVSDELQAQRVVPQLQAFNRAVPEK